MAVGTGGPTVLYLVGASIFILVAGMYWSRRYAAGRDPTATVAGFNRALAALEPAEPRYHPAGDPEAPAPQRWPGGRDGTPGEGEPQ